MFLNVGLKKARQCSCKGGFWKKKKEKKRKNKQTLYVVFRFLGEKGPDGGAIWLEWSWSGDGKKKKKYGHLYRQTAKEHVFMSHDVCECVILLAVRGERVWARRQQIHPPLGAQSEGRWGCCWESTRSWGRIPWQCKSKKLRAGGRWDDTNQTVNSPFRGREDRQALILHFQTLPLPGEESVPHTIYGFTM